jgi:hypothetical protein
MFKYLFFIIIGSLSTHALTMDEWQSIKQLDNETTSSQSYTWTWRSPDGKYYDICHRNGQTFSCTRHRFGYPPQVYSWERRLYGLSCTPDNNDESKIISSPKD